MTKKVNVENALEVPRGNYADTLQKIVAAGFCPFCEEHLLKHHQRPIIERNEHWLVTENSWPYEGSTVHLLFVARKHVERTEDLDAASWEGLHALYRSMVKKYRLEGATLFLRSGHTALTGATVNHLHAHAVSGIPKSGNTKPITALIGFKN